MKKKDIRLSLPSYIRQIMARYDAIGEEIYLVGGSLRDLLLGLEPHDYDLASSASPQVTCALFSDCRVIETGIKHGTVTVLWDGQPVEITTFRVDGDYADSRHPDRVTFTKKITEDLSRRDFTVNAMAYHEKTGLVDPFGGQEDLRLGILRAVGDPKQRFLEDALRIMRAFRFSAQLGFSIHEDTLNGCVDSKYRLTLIAKERIASELIRLLLSDYPEAPLRSMLETGVFEFVLPNFKPDPRLFGLLTAMPREDVARLGLFFSSTDEASAVSAMKNLKLSGKQITGAAAILRGSACSLENPTDCRRLIASCGVYAPLAARASILKGNSPEEALVWVTESSAPTSIRQLAISGRDLGEIGFTGQEIGKTLKILFDMVLEHPEKNDRETLLAIAMEIRKG